MAKASAPPGVLTPICRIEVVKACNFSLTACQESPRDVFPQELSHMNGPNFLGVNFLLVTRDGVFWNVSGDFLRFRQRANPLVIVELLRGRVFVFLEKQQLRIEQEATLFWQVSRGPLDCEKRQDPGTSASSGQTVASRCSRRSPAGPGELNGDSLTWGSEAILAPSSRSAPVCIALPPGKSGHLGAVRTGGMSSDARTPRDEGCSPVPAAVRRALRGATDQSLHGFAGGSSGCQGT